MTLKTEGRMNLSNRMKPVNRQLVLIDSALAAQAALVTLTALVILATLAALPGCGPRGALNEYIEYEAMEQSKVFRVRVNGREVFVARETCYGDSVFHTAQFFVEGSAEIEIECAETIEAYEVRPYHKGISAHPEGNLLSFRVGQPEMLLVNINGLKPLCLFQTPPETDRPAPDEPDVLYFGRGTHHAGVILARSNQTIYLEQGAYVKGRIYGEGVEQVSVKGRGILDARGYTDKPEKICGLEFRKSSGILIDGIGLRTGEWWQSLFLLCNDVEVKNMNLMSFGTNNDGIDIDGVTNFRASHCFIGCGDDGFGWHAVDAEANGEPPTRNCLAENCVIYNTHAGNGLRIGASMETTLFEDITFRDITVFVHANAGIRSDHSDWATCKNIRFENFYIEQPGRPIEIRIEKTRYSNSTGFRDERGHIDGLVFKNVMASGGHIVLEGFDQDHQIENVAFIDCWNDGKKIDSHESIETNTYVRNIVFK